MSLVTERLVNKTHNFSTIDEMKGRGDMKNRTLAALLSFCLFAFVPLCANAGVTKEDYLRVIKEANTKIWQVYETSQQTWKRSDSSLREDQPMKPNIHWGRLDGLLYSVTGEKKYA